jgi:hypothetical protein
MQTYKQEGDERARQAGMTGGDRSYRQELLRAAKASWADKLKERIEAYDIVINKNCRVGQVLNVVLPDAQGDEQGASFMTALWCDYSKQIVISTQKDQFACVYAGSRRVETHLVELPNK